MLVYLLLYLFILFLNCSLHWYSLSSNEDSGPRGRADKLTIKEILNAAGVTSLDDPSDALNAKGKPFRRHGIVLHVAINYQNADSVLLGTGYMYKQPVSFRSQCLKTNSITFNNRFVKCCTLWGRLETSHTEGEGEGRGGEGIAMLPIELVVIVGNARIANNRANSETLDICESHCNMDRLHLNVWKPE